MRWLRMIFRWRLSSYMVVLPIIAIPFWLYADWHHQVDRLKQNVIQDAIQRRAHFARMEKSHRDEAAHFSAQAAACLEQSQKARSPEEKATWSEKAARHHDEARKALVIAEECSWSKQVEQSALRAIDR